MVVPVVLLTTFINFRAPTKIGKIAQQFFTAQQFSCFHSALFLFILLHAIFWEKETAKRKPYCALAFLLLAVVVKLLLLILMGKFWRNTIRVQ